MELTDKKLELKDVLLMNLDMKLGFELDKKLGLEFDKKSRIGSNGKLMNLDWEWKHVSAKSTKWL